MPDLKHPIEAAMALAAEKSTCLGLAFGQAKVTPGQYITKEDAKVAPALSFDGATGTYIVLGIDLDAPFPRWAFLSPVLHWNQPGLKPKLNANGSTSLIAGDDTSFIADYAGPGPPPGSAPHRYVFLLYNQPEALDVVELAAPGRKKMGMMPRIKYDLNAFVESVGLGPVVACNYFVSN